ncbi:MAG: phospho-N-acetylmuramoyl-pentapeptide-transferase [Pontiellaceae bacterium]|nr:phospho-N-acetylmuramoyl-pentapeptide-transferase [Pontiellaceae bacterium]
MFYYLSELNDYFSPLRIFQYITVRTFAAAGTAFVFSLLLTPWLINKLKQFKARQQFRTLEAQQDYQEKSETPTMGGLMIISATLVSSLLWAQPNFYVLLSISTMAWMGGIGFMDDWLKIRQKNLDGLNETYKLLLQGAWVLILLGFLRSNPETWLRTQQLFVLFLKHPIVPAMGLVLSGLFIFGVLGGASNAVNLTDGLDGLAIGCTNPAALAYLVMAYAAGNAVFADYLQIPYVAGGGELAVFCGALLGAGLGFLWFNAAPALIIMGDTGSLAIGGALAIVAILIKQELTLVIVGGVFVMQALSVLIQRYCFKFTRLKYGVGKRVFLMAPLHHHFEKLEKLRAEQENRDAQKIETRIVARFVILAIIFALAGIASLKIR